MKQLHLFGDPDPPLIIKGQEWIYIRSIDTWFIYDR